LCALLPKYIRSKKAIQKATKKIESAEKSKIKMHAKIDKLNKKIVSADETIKKNKESIENKKGSAGKTDAELAKEQEKFKNVDEDQEAIKAKIRAIQAL
jgi:peptidoglycan hydrolase CwlO-like protein